MVSLMGGLALAVNISVVQLNKGVSSWEDVGRLPWWHPIMALVFMVGVGALGYRLGKRWYPRDKETSGEVQVTELGPEERAVWFGTVLVKWPVTVLGGAAIGFVFIPSWGWLIAAMTLVPALLLTRVGVKVDEKGLSVRLGGIVPVKNHALGEIRSVRAIDLESGEWGGWGWRLVPNGSAIVLRRGDAIEMTLIGGRRFAVTVDDATTGAALLNGLVARRSRKGRAEPR